MKIKKGEPFPLGVTETEQGVNFSVRVQGGKSCSLLLYRSGMEEPEYRLEMPEDFAKGELRTLLLTEFHAEAYEYNYLIEDEIVTDPYVKSIVGADVWGEDREEGTHKIRGKLLNPSYDWEGDMPLGIPEEEVIAYSIHVRGFTKHSSSKVKHRGTFAGVAEKLPYLKELGVNQIQCMPVYEFNESGTYRNYWGYGKAFCFAPKSAYAAFGDGVKELKDMIKACHREGVEVVLELPFYTGASPLLMIDCLRYYRTEYHVDGFLLNDYLAPMNCILDDPLLKRTKLLKKQDDFQTVMRRFLKGDEGMIGDVTYWLKHLGQPEGCYNYITSHNGFTLSDLVSYDGKHNELNNEKNQDGPVYNYSWNCGVEGPTRKRAVAELRKKQVRNAFCLLLLSQGTPCILYGDEFGNSQKGNNNVYCQDNLLSWLDWRKLEKEQELFAFVKFLIRFRKEHHVFCPAEEMSGFDKTACGVPDVSYHGRDAWQIPAEVASRQLGVYYHEGTEDCFVAYNMHWEKHSFALPSLKKGKKWYMVFSTADGGIKQEEILSGQKEIIVEERSVTALVGR